MRIPVRVIVDVKKTGELPSPEGLLPRRNFAKRVVNFSQTEDRKNSGKVKDGKGALFFVVDQSVLDCIAHKMSDVVDPEFVHDIGAVGVDRSGTDEQFLSDLRIC